MKDIVNKLAQANNAICQIHVRGREDATQYLTAIAIIDEVIKELLTEENKNNG